MSDLTTGLFAELLAAKLVLFCSCSCSRMTRTIPIVFATVADPVGAGYVNSLARPAA